MTKEGDPFCLYSSRSTTIVCFKSKEAVGSKLKELSDKIDIKNIKGIEEKINKMVKFQKAPVYQFVESIEKINELNNGNFDVLCDDEYVLLPKNIYKEETLENCYS